MANATPIKTNIFGGKPLNPVNSAVKSTPGPTTTTTTSSSTPSFNRSVSISNVNNNTNSFSSSSSNNNNVSSIVTCLKIGSTLDDLKKSILVDTSIPYYALVRFTLGSGTFKRDKLAFLSIFLDTVSTLKKAKAGSKKAEINKLCGDTALNLVLSTPDELEIDNLLIEVSKNVKIDDSTSSVNIKQLKADYEAMIAFNNANGFNKSKHKHKVSLSSGVGRKTAKELNVKADAVLQAIHQQMGIFNWSIYEPSEPGKPLVLQNGGSLSVLEMKRYLTDTLVGYGLLRIGFGTGKFRRIKYIFFSYCGSKAPISSRGKMAGSKAYMRQCLGHANMEMQASTPDELSLGAVIAKVKASSVIDGDEVHTADKTYNIEEFMASLKEEAESAGNYFGDSGDIGDDDDDDENGKIGGIPPMQAINDVRKDGSGINWALFTPVL